MLVILKILDKRNGKLTVKPLGETVLEQRWGDVTVTAETTAEAVKVRQAMDYLDFSEKEKAS